MKTFIFIIALLSSVTVGHSQNFSFLDRTPENGLGNTKTYNNQGLAIGDFNGDGLEDIYVSAMLLGKNRFLVNHGNFIFTDVADFVGIGYFGSSRCSSWGDIDNDGDPDLYVGNRDENDILYINNGDSTFSNETTIRGIDNPGSTTSVTIGDVNNDGWLDIYISNIQSRNQLYMNDGTGHFTEQATERGVDDLAVGMGAVIFDYDNDGDVDIYQCHDAQVPYILYRNDGTGHFENVSAEANVNYPGFGMGVDAGDYNQDGQMDMYITNLYENVLYKNNGDGTFEDVAGVMTCNDQGMGWGNVFTDVDNDRLPDIYVSNDSYFSPFDNVLYHNQGDMFSNVSGMPWNSPYGGYATVSADLNDDGKMDILVANNGAPGVQLFQNITSNENHYVSFHLEGVQSNRDAIGARIQVHTSAGIQYDQVIGNSGFASHNGRWIHFGLEDQTQIDKVIIHWPSGVVEQLENLNTDQKFKVREGEGVISAVQDLNKEVKSCVLYSVADALIIHLPSTGALQAIHIVDLAGKKVSTSYSVSDDQVQITLPALPAGIYQVILIQSGETCSGRFWHTGTN